MNVIRKEYLEKIRLGKDDLDMIKVITGVRRCGKSTLMEQYINMLISEGVPKKNIVHINLETIEYDWITNREQLYKEIFRSKTTGTKYVLIDEIQRIEEWEKAANSLASEKDVDLYITGSNAYLLSSELSTYISGRYVEIKMLPFSFREYLEANPVTERTDIDVKFREFLRFGGMPIIDPKRGVTYSFDVLNSTLDTIFGKDVGRYIKARRPDTLANVERFVMDNIGNLTNRNNIAGEIGLSQPTVSKYIEAMERAFVIYKANRYDVVGRKILAPQVKYYSVDTGLRNAILGNTGERDLGRQLENVVYLELVRRGYAVVVGSYNDREIDFSATKNGTTEYFQVTMTMMDDSILERELDTFLSIRDNFPKTILSMDRLPREPGKGIIHRNVIDWLLDG